MIKNNYYFKFKNKIMNDITKVGETINSKESMTSLEIAEVTGKEHSNVMRDICVIYE